MIIGDNTFIDAGAVIGCEGLLHMTENGNQVIVRHAGGVNIGQNVVILSNAVIARSIHETLFTNIGDYSLIGIATTIGHEVQIGKNCVVAGNCVIARRATLEDGVRIASSVVVREYLHLCRNAQVKAGSVVVEDVRENDVVSGNFAVSHQKHLMEFLKSKQKSSALLTK